MSDLTELYNLQQKAKRLEKLGSDKQALEVYLEIHKNHKPNTYDSFERPIIILTKYRRYEEAIDLCEKAISLVKEGKISGTVDMFQRRLDKILERYDGGQKSDDSNKKDKKKTKKEKKTKESKPSEKRFWSKKTKPAPSEQETGEKETDEKKEKFEDVSHKDASAIKENVVEAKMETDKEPEHITDDLELLAEIEAEALRRKRRNLHEEDFEDSDEDIEEETPPQSKYERLKGHGKTFSFYPPGFRSKKKISIILASAYYALALVFSLPDNYFLFLTLAFAFFAFAYFIDLLSYKSNNRSVAITVIALIIAILATSFSTRSVIRKEYYENIEVDTAAILNGDGTSDSDNSGDGREANGSDSEDPDEEKLPVITEGHKEIAKDEILKNHLVKAINLFVEDDTISFGILVEQGTSYKESKEIGEDLARVLSGAIAASYEDIDGPTTLSLGDIYDSYRLMGAVGVSSDEIIAKGTKNKSSSRIYWTKN